MNKMQEYNYNPNNKFHDLIDTDSDICIELPDDYSQPWVTLPKKVYNELTSLKRRGVLSERDFYLAVIKFAY